VNPQKTSKGTENKKTRNIKCQNDMSDLYDYRLNSWWR